MRRGRRRRPAAPSAGRPAARSAGAPRARPREVHDDVEAAGERLVDVLVQVAGQDHQAVVLEPLEQVADLEVGVAVGAVLDLAALAEQRVGLVEEQHRLAVLGLAEGRLEVLLGLADPLGDHPGEVDLEQAEPERAGDDLGGERLAGARARR